MRCEDCQKPLLEQHAYLDDSGAYCEQCFKAWFEREALNAGIPLSVIRGTTKLSDHFSEEYIDWKRGKP